MSWWNPVSWFKFDEEEMKEKLEKLHASVESEPENIDKLEKLFLKYQAEVEKHMDELKDKGMINAQLQAIKKSIEKAKSKQGKKAA